MKQLKSLVDKPIIGGIVKKAISSLASNEANSISEHFSMYLKPQIAKSDDLRREVYKLRHQVYCEELHFEDVRQGYEEFDEFDPRAIHCFIRHLSSDQLAGTVRLITSASDDQLLPMEKFCLHAVTDPKLHPKNFARNEICEMSRLAVPAAFRKRQIDKFAGVATGAIDETVFSATELRCFPYIAICLYMAAAAMSYKTKRYHTFVMMEPRLARSLSFVGINFIKIGDTIEFHGQRAPYYIDSRTLKKSMSSGYLKLLEAVEYDLFHTETEKAGSEDGYFGAVLAIV
ncbi:MAG TPA: PEP-CTERM/exosortase system-associated acyltransferase [Rheinheimera sp.]|uniref:PEP-CTERM/exosortase system-associated acyltransferase n=1 Tax=Rheinheimera sp. TaxID=1869214 RepID=UPI000ECF144A|nr:PEP-CTERM/exosortase system-associated acyltransferase [Rheinheimera sp.]HCU65339.1 PEP-CTERM/exosortase system-associated acyltransferase [Rheinheimera sp.]